MFFEEYLDESPQVFMYVFMGIHLDKRVDTALLSYTNVSL